MKDNTNAIMQFITAKGNIETLLQNLTAIVEDHLGHSPDEINWSHVGTMAAIQVALTEVAEMAGLDTYEILDSE